MEFIKKENKLKKFYRTIMTIVITAFITALVVTVVFYEKFGKDLIKNKKIIANKRNSEIVQKDGTSDMSSLTVKLDNLKKIISKMYIGEMDDTKMLEGAIKGYVEGIGDEYTQYFTAEEMNDFMEDTTGKYVGIGIYMQELPESDKILIIGVMKGSPAEQAGLMPGDIIEKVDGIECKGSEMTEASSKIKGQEGTKASLDIKRGEEDLHFDIERKQIEVPQVASEVLDDNIGLIGISSFSEDAAKHFEDQYKELKQKGITSLIIDLRNNGGGIVDEALKIGELFSKKGDKLLIKKGNNDKEDITFAKQDVTVDIPVVVLVNEYSASASEILAGILRDNASIKLIGKNTYGKGVIQIAFTLPDGSGLKVTTDEYFTPNESKINEVGLKPDIEVELNSDSFVVEKKDDTQLQKAIEILKENR